MMSLFEYILLIFVALFIGYSVQVLGSTESMNLKANVQSYIEAVQK